MSSVSQSLIVGIVIGLACLILFLFRSNPTGYVTPRFPPLPDGVGDDVIHHEGRSYYRRSGYYYDETGELVQLGAMISLLERTGSHSPAA